MTASIPTRPVRLTFYSDAEYFGGAEEYLVLLARRLDRAAFAPDLVLPDGLGFLSQDGIVALDDRRHVDSSFLGLLVIHGKTVA